MTLTELMPALKQLSTPDKIKLIRLLAEDLESQENIEPLEPHKTYDLPTPYDAFGAGAVLMQAMELTNQV
jgi:hypothetical protein